ncbi:hypothetical protein BZB76_5607 [Actinomadura pelletieri DSM 43383]|uniref:PE family protein n=1 Tax=Actinomadura pelletieri DSM 43383 TaxID=1120940 RepID=A0A495QHB8_9ACTN|nr:hypothetical protein [Actinomadura pelletieri]RKS71121.1 hypothetical protein BZB76_5607 [Actinomadura pelletieri DSM 43383]
MGHPKYLPPTGGKEIKIDHDTIDDIVKKLERDLNELKRRPTHSQLINDETPPESAMGNYQAGRTMYATITAARDQIGNTFDQFVTAYEQVIEAIRASNKNHRTADDASKHGVQAAGNPNTAI